MTQKNIWKLSNVTIHPIIISVEGVVSKQLTKTIEELALPSSIAKGLARRQYFFKHAT